MNENQASEAQRYLSFTLAGGLFAINIASVREILDMVEVTRIPQLPGAVQGVVNVRGAAVPIMDLRRRFGLEPAERTVHTRIIIVEIPTEAQPLVLGAVADSVKEVMELTEENVGPPPDTGVKAEGGFLLGIGRREGQFVLLLDIEKVLRTGDVLELEDMEFPSGPEALPAGAGTWRSAEVV